MTPSALVLASIPLEAVIVGAVVLLLFGGTQIPKLARSLGQAQKEFKQGLDDGKNSDEPKTSDEGKSKGNSKEGNDEK